MESNNDDKVDIWALYQTITNSISFSKNQQWYMVYYGISGLGGTVGISRLFSNPIFNIFLIVFSFLITLSATCYLLKNELTMVKDRRRIKKIRASSKDPILADLKLDVSSIPPKYDSIWYDWIFWIPLTLTLWIGFVFVSSYLILESGINNELITWGIVVIVSLIIIFQIIHAYYKSKSMLSGL